MRQVGEASVEEILESIKKVIARDSREVAVESRRQRDTRAAARSQPASSAGDEAIGDGDDDDGILDLAMSARFLEEPEESPAIGNGQADEPLITPGSREAMRHSLAALAMMAEPPAQPRLVRSGETSLEDMVRELLRPALAEWLDKNLPPLVERLVAAEIARIVGKKS